MIELEILILTSALSGGFTKSFEVACFTYVMAFCAARLAAVFGYSIT